MFIQNAGALKLFISPREGAFLEAMKTKTSVNNTISLQLLFFESQRQEREKIQGVQNSKGENDTGGDLIKCARLCSVMNHLYS